MLICDKFQQSLLRSHQRSVVITTIIPRGETMPEIVFQQAVDTMLQEKSQVQGFASATGLSVDDDNGSDTDNQVLLRFDDLQFDQIPDGATITKAILTLQTVDTGSGAALHRLLTSWAEEDTWQSLASGIQANGTEAVATADLVTGRIGTLGPTTFDVTTSVQAWADGAENNGWVFLPSGSDGWDFSSSEGSFAPILTVEYTTGTTNPPPSNTAPEAADDTAITQQNTPVRIAVLANDSDPNGDTLTVSGIATVAAHGTTTANSDGTITYTPAAGYLGDDGFVYTLIDSKGGSDTGTVSIKVADDTSAPLPSEPFQVALTPTDSTPTVAGSGDRADDPAVILHPSNLSQSVILGTDKATGGDGRLYVYDLNGTVIETASPGRSINNVDVRYQFDLGGAQTALIGASERSDGDLIFYTYDFAARDLRPVGEVSSSGVYGFALGYVDGRHYAYAATNSGTIRQYELDGSSGTVTAQLVRTFNVGSEAEGLVVDDQMGQLYVAEENVGIWRYDASAEAGTSRVLVDKVGSGGHLTADVEGLAIYHESDGSGILIASSQGEDAFEFYDTATNAWLGTLELKGVTHTDGLDVTNANLGGAYAEGLFITQVDGVNNFAFTSWGAISDATGLPTNSSYDARYDPYIL
jgi:myo-inositol-hexaphosphate 3-phosphohydrolase